MSTARSFASRFSLSALIATMAWCKCTQEYSTILFLSVVCNIIHDMFEGMDLRNELVYFGGPSLLSTSIVRDAIAIAKLVVVALSGDGRLTP